MLAVVSPKRIDGGSSFRSLYNYARFETDERTGETIDRGDPWISGSVLSPDSVAAEMKLVAIMNYRAGDPVFHYILTWPMPDAPTREQWQICVKRTLTALGLDEHQAFAVPHADTDNFHVHVGVNRIHPETYKAHAPEWFKYELDKECRRLEREFGWSESRGLYRWDDVRDEPVKTEARVLDAWREERENAGRKSDGKAAKIERYADRESLESYCKGEPAKALRLLMSQRGANWQIVHQRLQPFGLRLHSSDKGGFTVSNEDGSVHAKASKAFRVMFSGKTAQAWREQTLGDFRPPITAIWSIEAEGSYSAEHQAKRDPATREIRKAERKVARDALMDRYRAEKAAHLAASRPAQDARRGRIAALQAERAALKAQRTKERAMVSENSTLNAQEKRLAYGLLALQYRQRDVALAVALSNVRSAKASPFPTRSAWAAVEAEKGDAVAISYVRGLYYAEQRKKKRGELEETENTIRPAVPCDPIVPPFSRLAWRFDRSSASVLYMLDGETAFVDRGPRLDIQPGGMTDEAIVAALLIARDKFGPTLRVDGSAAFRARVVRLVAQQPQLRGVAFIEDSMNRALADELQSIVKEKAPVIQTALEGTAVAETVGLAMPSATAPQANQHCVGPVVAIDARYAYQHNGRGEILRHELHSFERTPRVGERLRAVYKDGKVVKAVLEPTKGRGRAR